MAFEEAWKWAARATGRKMFFINEFGAEFSWEFQIETDDYAVAMEEAVLCFWSGLTDDERKDAAKTIRVKVDEVD